MQYDSDTIGPLNLYSLGDGNTSGNYYIDNMKVEPFTNVLGCMDTDACNFDSTETINNELCTYPAKNYLNCDGSCKNDTNGDEVCDEDDVLGCMDKDACNFDSTATINEQCTYPTKNYLNCDGKLKNKKMVLGWGWGEGMG